MTNSEISRRRKPNRNFGRPQAQSFLKNKSINNSKINDGCERAQTNCFKKVTDSKTKECKTHRETAKYGLQNENHTITLI
jgi:hypothetical protein